MPEHTADERADRNISQTLLNIIMLLWSHGVLYQEMPRMLGKSKMLELISKNKLCPLPSNKSSQYPVIKLWKRKMVGMKTVWQLCSLTWKQWTVIIPDVSGLPTITQLWRKGHIHEHWNALLVVITSDILSSAIPHTFWMWVLVSPSSI